jgi:hypothetical protein
MSVNQQAVRVGKRHKLTKAVTVAQTVLLEIDTWEHVFTRGGARFRVEHTSASFSWLNLNCLVQFICHHSAGFRFWQLAS